MYCVGCLCSLSRSFPVEVVGYKGENDVREPCCQSRVHIFIDGKGGGNGLEHDISQTEGESDTEGDTHSILPLPGGNRHTDEGEDEGGKG